MPDLLDEGLPQLEIWHPDESQQDDGNKEKQGTSNAIKDELHDADSVNTRYSTMRHDAFDFGEAALDKKSTATRGNLRDSELLEDSDTEDFLQSETASFFEEALEKADRAELRQGTRARNVLQFS